MSNVLDESTVQAIELVKNVQTIMNTGFFEGFFYGTVFVMLLILRFFIKFKHKTIADLYFFIYIFMLCFLSLVSAGEWRLEAFNSVEYPSLALSFSILTVFSAYMLGVKELLKRYVLPFFNSFFEVAILIVGLVLFIPPLVKINIAYINYYIIIFQNLFVISITLFLWNKKIFIRKEVLLSRLVLIVWSVLILFGDPTNLAVTPYRADVLYKGILLFELVFMLWIGNKFILQLSREHIELTVAKENLEALSYSDGLTSLYNRRFFDETLSTVLTRMNKTHQDGVCLIMLDVDHFKNFNDTYGHPAGDVALIDLANTIKENIRLASDFPCRYGGEEFIIIFSGPLSAALRVSEKIRVMYSQKAQKVNDQEVFITVSLGVALARENEESKELIARVDAALYNAKQSGRNRVCVAN
ncbi:sensor domain-containing diguanylate cyclase [Desulfovibrio litoralis]|uniref:diguanylate cyclase n=1 Tax=Desulfovibrio litoralis DSM 11393 TaxID=1121455 RepID=A0A1M7TES9_9BACT|nr:GGDEF domain-containing protein [Desulfovibrio litoralis]SHN69158.1 diguanylate cyclase (GGDEF) domain-containing protein [Desulfovibrio litoralis DSM 11393]